MRIREVAGLRRSPPYRFLLKVDSFAGKPAATLSRMLALPAISLACGTAHFFTHAKAFSNASCRVGALLSFFNASCIVGEHTPCMLHPFYNASCIVGESIAQARHTETRVHSSEASDQ